jgi:hypothetical protein
VEVVHTDKCAGGAFQEDQHGDIHHSLVTFQDIAAEEVGRASCHDHNLVPACYDLTMGDGWQQEAQSILLLREDHD